MSSAASPGAGTRYPHRLGECSASPEDWELREIPPEDKLLGPFSTTTRTELAADTGLGKTMIGLGIAHAKAIGADFLHWKAGRAGRVLIVDGEMPPGLIQSRLQLARSWFDLPDPLPRDRMCVLSKLDVDDKMPPLERSTRRVEIRFGTAAEARASRRRRAW